MLGIARRLSAELVVGSVKGPVRILTVRVFWPRFPRR